MEKERFDLELESGEGRGRRRGRKCNELRGEEVKVCQKSRDRKVRKNH